MQDAQKWRDLLGKIIKDPQEKQRIAGVLEVSTVTLVRWANGESKPRPQNLRLLVNALPSHRQTLLELLPKEFGASFAETVQIDDAEREIPSTFYARVLNAYCTLPRILRFSSVCDVILQQALKQLDPHRVGMEVTVVQCMYPSADGKIRSLRENMGRGTPPWNRELEQKILFLGAESLAGYVVTTGRPLAIQNRSEGRHMFPAQWVEWEESAMAYPIMLGELVAGCLLVSSTQANYFVMEARQKLIQYYAELLSAIFEPDAFYDMGRIELGRMPLYEVQRSLLASFRHRTSEVMVQDHLSLIEAERVVWQQIEEELLRLYIMGEK
ncbi:GAF domain-containing protein [Ktedonosporobacter rubrisoli]|uniref:GAF domain-containing protein n=1 Tax=Ktedonosporobacter rubrisoli TaxID=2509675 RepID=A0A4P6JSE4_KTERU|nr:GAF domain-containing protein [Ktedonosporobacter rubrisoli]QBD78437.1 GAF domain-containing protein [Ktedonosporobacter rubrisoli]